MLLVVALLVIVPIVELVVFVRVADWIGGWEALFLLLAISLLGAWLVKSQGVSVFRQGRAELDRRRVPGRAIVDGGLIVVAGSLLIVPGFVTAVLGLLLLVPLTRIPVRELLIRRWTRRYTVRRVGMSAASGPGTVSVDRVVVTERAHRGDGGPSEPQELGGQRAIESGGEPLG